MGERRKDALRLNFDKRLKLEFHGVKVTSDAGLALAQEKTSLRENVRICITQGGLCV